MVTLRIDYKELQSFRMKIFGGQQILGNFDTY